MKTNLKHLICILSAALLLSSCGEVPENAVSSSGSVDTLNVGNTEKYTVSSGEAYSDVDAAYSAGYKKVGLPGRETLDTAGPDGVYELELETVNKSCDEAWKAKKAEELASLFGTKEETSGMKIKTAKYSAAYMIDSKIKADAVTPLQADEIKSCEITEIDPKTLSALESPLKEAVKITEGYNEKAKAILGDELDSVVFEAVRYIGENASGCGVHIQKAYKNVPILPYTPLAPIESMLEEKNEVYPLNGYCFFNGDVRTVLYHPDNSYKAVRADKLEKIISFKGACDILEENLGEAAHYDFDKVALMYDPRVDTTKGEDFPNISCRPKWYFISFAEDFFSHGMYCFTVDCTDGTIQAAF